MAPLDLAVIILTKDEVCHIARAIGNVLAIASDVVVVDSGSSDGTRSAARRLGARVFVHDFVNHSEQFNWALRSCAISSTWVMRLDADEYLDETLVTCLRRAISVATRSTNGFDVCRVIRFMGTDIRHGGMSPLWVTRVWRNGFGRCENRWMDEHILVTGGSVIRVGGTLVDENLKSLTWWTGKHNSYASREAVDLLSLRYPIRGWQPEAHSPLTRQARAKRFIKMHVYARLPRCVRPWMFFAYRILLRNGWMDGRTGVVFHTLQGLWYRTLVDAKVAEVERRMGQTGCSCDAAIEELFGIRVEGAPDVAPSH